jgi:hypothetical protein
MGNEDETCLACFLDEYVPAMPARMRQEDGMADEWECRFGECAYPWLNLHEYVDEDGYTNLVEYIDQTHPYRI